MITKNFKFDVQNAAEKEINGEPVGLVSGYASTYGNVDRGGDIVVKGAFSKSLHRHRLEDGKINMLFQHKDHIGHFPISKVRDDERGLFLEDGIIALNVPEGRAAMSLLRTGSIDRMSIGFNIIDQEMSGDNRMLKELELWEASLVSEPMNKDAAVTQFKSATPFKDLPISDRDRAWDSDAAISRIREFTRSQDEPSMRYLDAFFWYDRENRDNFGAYKLPFADVIGGKLMAVPCGIFAAAAAMAGARGGVDIQQEDRASVIRNINRYYDKMNLDSPIKCFVANEENKEFLHFGVSAIRNINTRKEFEQILRKCGSFSREAASHLAYKFYSNSDSDNHYKNAMENTSFKNNIRNIIKELSNIKDII